MNKTHSLRALRLALLCGLVAAGASSQKLAAQTSNPPFAVYEFFPNNLSTEIYTQNGFFTAIQNADYAGCAYGSDLHLTFNASGLPEDLSENGSFNKLVIGQTHLRVLDFCETENEIYAIGSASTTDGSNIYEFGYANGTLAWKAVQGIATGIDADDFGNCVTKNSGGDVWALSPSKGWVRIFTGSTTEKASQIAVYDGTYYMVNSAGVVKSTNIPLGDLNNYTGRNAKKAVWTVDAQFAALGKPATFIAVSHARGAGPVVAISGSAPIKGNSERNLYIYVHLPNASGYTLLNSLVGPMEPSLSATCGVIENQ